MRSEQVRNRWGIAWAAVCMQICLGAVYGWSVFEKPLMGTEHWAETAVQLNFTLANCAHIGLWQYKAGPRKVAATAGIIYGIGYMLSGFCGQPSLI